MVISAFLSANTGKGVVQRGLTGLLIPVVRLPSTVGGGFGTEILRLIQQIIHFKGGNADHE